MNLLMGNDEWVMTQQAWHEIFRNQTKVIQDFRVFDNGKAPKALI